MPQPSWASADPPGGPALLHPVRHPIAGPRGRIRPRSGDDGGVVPGDDFEEISDGDVTWRFDREFLTSTWTCLWGRGCQGILDRPAAHLGQGCCSVGAGLDDGDEARTVGALATMIPPALFQHHREAAAGGIYRDAERDHTRLVDDACIFLNRPGFPGGAGCALHLAALAEGEPVTDWKPSVCWQLPLRIDWADDPGVAGREVATVRRWTRADWGDEGDTMAWCCTEADEAPEAFAGDRPVVESLADELGALVGTRVYVRLRSRLGPRAAPHP